MFRIRESEFSVGEEFAAREKRRTSVSFYVEAECAGLFVR